MHWPRAKAYLIGAFVILDLFLGYQLWTQRQQSRDSYFPATTRYEQRQALAQLARANVAVDVMIPTKSDPMEWLVVGRPNIQPTDLERRFFPGETPELRRVSAAHGYRTYLLGLHSELSVFEDGRLEFKRYGIVPSPGNALVDATRAKDEAAAFIKQYGGLPAEAVPDRVWFDPQAGIYHVTYYQEYQGKAQYGAKFEVLVSRDGQAYDIQQTWPNPIGFEGPKKALLPATDALLRLAGSLAREPSQDRMHVTGIGLGYYSQAYDSNRWSEPPVWRIQLGDGSVYHINAYTGQLEP